MKNRLHVLLIVLAIVSCFGGYYYWYNHSTETTISVVTESKDKLSTTRLFELHNNIRKKHKLKSVCKRYAALVCGYRSGLFANTRPGRKP